MFGILGFGYGSEVSFLFGFCLRCGELGLVLSFGFPHLDSGLLFELFFDTLAPRFGRGDHSL